MAKILIVDDEAAIADLIELTLAQAGYKCDTAASGTEAEDKLEKTQYDLVLLDVMLPQISGFELMEYLQPAGTPVIFLTANDLERDVLSGFDMGAEDYVTKPFNMQILLRRVEVVLRRAGVKQPAPQADRWSDGWLTLDFSALTAQRGEEKLVITPNEYKLLKTLTEHSGQILTRQVLLERLWDSDGNFIDDHTLTVTMNRLRAKIEDEAHTYIKTVRGMGYIWTGGKP